MAFEHPGRIEGGGTPPSRVATLRIRALAPGLLGLLAALAAGSPAVAQIMGNAGFGPGSGRAQAEQAERSKRVLATQDLPPASGDMFIEASVLINLKADEYVAVFGVTEEAESVSACARKTGEIIKALKTGFAKLGIDDKDMAVDFIAQNRIYGFEVTGDLAREKPVGFEIKKNVSVRYHDSAMLDALLLAAAEAQVFDLIKVDYVVKDLEDAEERLSHEAARIIAKKASRYETLLGRKIKPGQVFADRTAVHHPTRMYDSYVAQESEQFNPGFDRQRMRVQSARKSRTFYYNGLDADGFDTVINPGPTEPVVQVTLYLKVKYETEPAKAR